ncbi:unnamed protein product [Cylicocyclus nassatus]|uniref:Uncharacterized protein n=1 Tax=Cylicocyclus nassatus TaxID=53992 RepID=A0AA36GXY6_CYLNA|nr:unnamed protein product [Cylicocyclus nassatus]
MISIARTLSFTRNSKGLHHLDDMWNKSVVFTILILPILSNAQTWKTGDNSTAEGCSAYCSVGDGDVFCWNSTLSFFTKALIGQLRHYIATQVDIDQWYRRHGKPYGQDMKLVTSEIERTLLSQLHPNDILTYSTVLQVAKVVGERISSVSNHVITWVPHFQCPIPCEYHHHNFRDLLIASMILNVCLVLLAAPFTIRDVYEVNSRSNLFGWRDRVQVLGGIVSTRIVSCIS